METKAPEVMNAKWIVHWSPTAKQLEGVKQGKAIITKARKFVELDLVEYDTSFSLLDMEATKEFFETGKHKGVFKVYPIPGYNKTTYTVSPKDGHFQCNCQFYNTVSKNWEHPTCSHIQAVKFWLEIRRWNRQVKGGNSND